MTDLVDRNYFKLPIPPTNEEVKEAKEHSSLPTENVTQISSTCSEIPFLMQEVTERFKLYGKEFSWTKFEFDALRDRISNLGGELRELGVRNIPAIWAKTLGPLSKVVRPTKTQHSVDPMIEAFDVKETSNEIVEILQDLSIPAAISKNPDFANLGVIVIPDDFFGGVDHDKRPCQTLMTESEMQIREAFLKEKVVLKESDSDEFKAAIMQSYVKILTLKGGLAFLEECCAQSTKNKLPLVYFADECTGSYTQELVSINHREKSHVRGRTDSFYFLTNARHIYLTLIHELQHCCNQDPVKNDYKIYTPTLCNFEKMTVESTQSLWSNSLEYDAIATENKYRNFYPERFFHFWHTTDNLRNCLIQGFKFKFKYGNPNELIKIINLIKSEWYFFIQHRLKLKIFLAEKFGSKETARQLNRERERVINKYNSLLYALFSEIQKRWPEYLPLDEEIAFLEEHRRNDSTVSFLKNITFKFDPDKPIVASLLPKPIITSLWHILGLSFAYLAMFSLCCNLQFHDPYLRA